LTPGGSSTVHIYTQTVHRTTCNWEECRLFPTFASSTLAFAWQLRKKHRKNSVWNIWCCYPENPNNSFCCRWALNCWFIIYAYVCIYVRVYVSRCVYVYVFIYFFYFIPHAPVHLVILHAWIYLCYLYTEFSFFAYSMWPVIIILLWKTLKYIWFHCYLYLI